MISFFLQDFRQNGDDAIVDIEVRMKLDKIAGIMQEGLLKKFKLTTSLSTNNMHLFDAEGKIKKYDSPEESMYTPLFSEVPNTIYYLIMFQTFYI